MNKQEAEMETLRLAWQMCADIWRIQHGEHTLGYGPAPRDPERAIIFNALFRERFGEARIANDVDANRTYVGDTLMAVSRHKRLL